MHPVYTCRVHILTDLYWLLTLLSGTIALAMILAHWVITRRTIVQRLLVYLCSFYLVIMAAFLKVLLKGETVPDLVFYLAVNLGTVFIGITLPRWVIGHQQPQNPLPDLVLPISITGLILTGVVLASAFMTTPVIISAVNTTTAIFMVLSILYSLLVQLGPETLRSRLIKIIISLIFLVPIALDILGVLPGKDQLAPFGLRVVPLFYIIHSWFFIGDFVQQYRTLVRTKTSGPAKPSAKLEDGSLVNADSAKQYNLSPREIEVANLIVKFYSYKEIGTMLNISLPTVKSHATNVYRKTASANRRDLLKTLAASS